jgi:hypothetical protein
MSVKFFFPLFMLIIVGLRPIGSSCPTNSTNGKLGCEVSDVFTILDREGMAG